MWQKLQTDSQLAFQLYLIDRYDKYHSEENCITVSIALYLVLKVSAKVHVVLVDL